MNNQKPRVSIGMPVYNGEQFLKNALDAILTQTFEDFELIISDNASTDGTEEICRAYAAQDSRIQYYRHLENRGASWNFNHVFQLAQGEYFKWAAHDDVCAPTFLARCVEVLDQDPTVVLAHSRTVFSKADGQKWWEAVSKRNFESAEPHDRFRAVLSDFWCLQVFGLIRRQALSTTSLIAPYYGSDRLLLIELSLLGRFVEIPDALFFRRCHANQSSRLSARERDAWIAPQSAQRRGMLRYRGSIGYLRVILRSPLTFDQRSRCLAVLMRYFLYSKNWEKFFVRKVPTKV